MDNEGIDCTELARLSDCRLAYVTPSHQYPTGVVMSLARRLELLAWVEHNQGWIVEDDYDGEYRYSGAPWRRWRHSIDRVGSCTSERWQKSRSRRCAWVIWCCRPHWCRRFSTSSGGRSAFRSQHPSDDGRVHGHRAFPAAHPPHTPCGPESTQYIVGRLAQNIPASAACRCCGRVAYDGAGRITGPRVRTDRSSRQRRCRDQCTEQLLAAGFITTGGPACRAGPAAAVPVAAISTALGQLEKGLAPLSGCGSTATQALRF